MSKKKKGNRFKQGHALVVGVGGDLPNTVQDANGIADILQDSGRCAYPPNQVHLFTEKSATRDTVLAALDALSQSTNTQSTVLIYFSGHGYRIASPTGQFTYLMPYGYDTNRLTETAISGAEFAERLHAIPAQKLLVLLDCCHAGGVGDPEKAGLQMTKAALPSEAQELLSEGSGRVLIASSQEDELSFAGKPYSAFTLAAIEALCGAGVSKEDGYVRVADLALHAREVVPGRTKGRQHPILNFEQADNFVLSYYAGGATKPKGVPFLGEPEVEPEPGAFRGIDLRGQVLENSQQVNISGNVSVSGNITGGQVGNVVTQIGSVSDQAVVTVGLGSSPSSTAQPSVTGADMAQFQQALADLKETVAAQVSQDQREAAMERVVELEEAITGPKPDLTTIAYVAKWFNERFPELAAAVTCAIIHPTVKKIMAAAGEELAAQYRRRFGG